MKIAIVAEMLVKMGGAERVVSELVNIFPEADIFTLLYDEKKCGHVFPKHRIQTSFLQKYIQWGIPRQVLVSLMPRAIESFRFDEYDIVISSSSAFAHGIIVNSDTSHICYAHAPMRYAWDYTHSYTEEKTSGWKKFFRPWLYSTLFSLRLWDYTASGRADVLLANSKTTQKRIQKYWRKPSFVLYPPVDTESFVSIQSFPKILHQKTQPQNYYYIVSMLEPFKKIDIVLESFKQNPQRTLVIIGDGSQRKKFMKEYGMCKNIFFLGRQTDTIVQACMQHCKAFVFPGKEDFGITPVEAMACGKPVIFFNQGGVAETVEHGKTGIAFGEQTSQSFTLGLLEFEKKESSFDSDIIQHSAQRFSRKVFKDRLLQGVKKNLW